MNNRSRLALMVVQILIVSLMMALFGRLFYLQVAAGPKYKDAALSIQSRDVVSPANRGLIVDGYGVPLAMNKAGLAITIDRIAIDKLEDQGVAVMKRLSKLLKLQYRDIYQNTRLCGELPVGKKAGCWQGSRYQPIPITKSADPEIALQIVERSDEFPGVDAQPVAIRSYPSYLDVNAAHVLGYVGPLTEGDLLKGNGKQYFRSESIGKTGLEIQYDSFLRGEPGIRTVIVDRKESITRESQNTQPTPGDHLVTSLDVRLQASAEKALKDAVLRGRANGYTSDSGAAVVMDVRNGRILALASYPTYDPNSWEKGLTVQQAEDLFSEKKSVPALNRALQGLFAPASTFKVVSAVAAASAGYDLNANYQCPSQVQVGTRAFQNFDSKNQGTMNMKKAMVAVIVVPADIKPAVVKLPPLTLPVAVIVVPADTSPAVVRLPPVMLPVATTCAPVVRLPPDTLPVTVKDDSVPTDVILGCAAVVTVPAVVAAPVRAPTNVVDVTLVSPATVVTVAPSVSVVDPSVTAALANLACAKVPLEILSALILETLAPDPLSVPTKLPLVVLPVTAKLVSVPTEVMLVCAAVLMVPVSVVAVTVVAPRLPTLALPVADIVVDSSPPTMRLP